MIITITAKTNCAAPYLNTLNIRTKDGSDITIDRQRTEYPYDETKKEMTMDWVGVYIWDGETENYDVPDDIFENVAHAEIEIEDDAPKSYTFVPESITANGIDLPVKH